MISYVTIASNHPKGSGYYEVHAEDIAEARTAIFHLLGVKWAFQYEDFEMIDELDRKKHGTIKSNNGFWFIQEE